MISCKNKSGGGKRCLTIWEKQDWWNAKSFEIAEQNYNECVKVIDNAKAVINEKRAFG